MLDVLIFIFSSFWVWLGFVILLGIVVSGLAIALDGALKVVVSVALSLGRPH
jgi:hypothetical protein